MGGCGSKGAKVYAATDEDPLVAESRCRRPVASTFIPMRVRRRVRAKIAARDDGGRGCPVGELNALLVDIGAEALAPGDAATARAAIDVDGTGFFRDDVFLDWFHAFAPPELAPAPPEVHPSVLRGLKDDGEASGTGGFDDDLLAQRPPDGGAT